MKVETGLNDTMYINHKNGYMTNIIPTGVIQPTGDCNNFMVVVTKPSMDGCRETYFVKHGIDYNELITLIKSVDSGPNARETLRANIENDIN